MLLLPIVAIGQSTDQNFKKAVTYKEPTSTTITAPTGSQAAIQVAYYDGLGRPIQQISNKQSASGKNIVTHIEYDQYGRQVKDYLPFKSESSSLDIETNALDNTLNYLDYLGQSPFSEKLLEASPIGAVLKQSAPGTDWAMGQGHEIKYQYQTNITNEVKLYKATSTWSPNLGLYDIQFVNATGIVYYNANELYKTVTFDENNLETSQNFTVEFKDKEGKIILKRVNTSTEIFDTYYVYDQFGNLTYVLPPLVNTNTIITAAVLSGLCYQYKYDSRNRLVEKKLPGKQWEFIVYNNLNQPVATGPAKHPINGGSPGWLITKYDVFGRVTHTGWYDGILPNVSGRLAYQNTMNAIISSYEARLMGVTTINGLDVSYTDKVYPENAINAYTLLTVNYYDDYLYSGAPLSTSIPTNIESQPVNNLVKGLTTGSWVRVLQSGSITGEKSYSFYDSKSRPIRNYKTNYMGGFTQVDTKLDFIGKIMYTITTHSRSTTTSTLKVKEAFTYTQQDRLLTQTHQINDGTIQLLAKNEYDELGQLIVKRVGGTDVTGNTPLQKVDYEYNIRGWLKNINDVSNLSLGADPRDLFSFMISYNVVDYGVYNMTPLFNGNVSEAIWRTNSDNVMRKYTYKYDGLNRLKNAYYKKPALVSPETNSYNESVTYDKNGNITALIRTGEFDDSVINLTIDNLTYVYNSTNPNQLDLVSDSTNNPNGFKDGINTGKDYLYDDNGNLEVDNNKSISKIKYNHLNLPIILEFDNGAKNISYTYNANGEKLKKTINSGAPSNVIVNTDYLDGFQYTNSILEFFPHAEGYVKNTVVNTVNIYNYVFNYTDHLGNVRLSYGLDSTNVLKILEENNYYPFGLSHKNYNTDQRTYNKNGLGNVTICSTCPTGYKYKYNGKEWQDELGLNMYDYGARNYDPAIGRWMNIDPLAETSRRFSPYVYALNNPVYFIDPDGMRAASPIFGSSGQFLGTDSEGFKGEVIFMDETKFLLSGGQGMNHKTALQVGSTLNEVIGDNPSETFTKGEINMVNNAINHIVSKTEGYESDFSQGLGTPYNSELHNGKTSSSYSRQEQLDGSGSVWRQSNDGDNAEGFGMALTVGNKVTYNLHEFGGKEFTVGNIQNTWVHEFGHIEDNRSGGNDPDHAKAILKQSQHPSWKNTTLNFRTVMRQHYSNFTGGKKLKN